MANCQPVFLVGFFSALVSSFLKVLLFLGVVRRGFLPDLVPQGRFWRDVLGSAVLGIFLMVVSHMF